MRSRDADVELEAVLSSLRQLRLQPSEKEAAKRALTLKMAQMPVSVVREEEDVRLLEDMDTLTASFLAGCKQVSLAETEAFEIKTSLQCFMQAKPRSANAPVISFLSVLGTLSLETSEKMAVREELVAAMRAPESMPQERGEEGFVSIFSSMLGGRSVLAFA